MSTTTPCDESEVAAQAASLPGAKPADFQRQPAPCDVESLHHVLGRTDSIILPITHPQQSTGAADAHGATAIQIYLLKICEALMRYGAPFHRLEDYARLTAAALDIPVQSFYMPGCMLISFSSFAPHYSSASYILRRTQSLDLSRLYDAHQVYKDVIHKDLAVEAATARIDEIMATDSRLSLWLRIPIYGLTCACVGPLSYNARPVDLPIIFALGTLVGISDLVLAPNSELYSHVFEVCSAILCSFVGRAFGSISWGDGQGFCFSAISQASIVMILPGLTVTNSALELQSKNIVSGSVRMTYSIIYILFLSFGFTIGITVYGAIHHNATSATTCENHYGVWWQAAFVVPFTVGYIVVNGGKWRNMPPMVAIAAAGWAVHYFSNQRFGTVPTLSQALGAVTIGVLAYSYSRIWHVPAVALMYPAIYIQVPGSLAASGSLISGLANANDLNNQTTPGVSAPGFGSQANGNTWNNQRVSQQLDAGYTMVEIAIAITVGLSISALIVYPLRKKTNSGIFGF